MKLKIITRLSLCCIVVLACFSSFAGAADKINIYTVNYPLQYFAQRIVGEHGEVVLAAPVDEDPAFWTPDADAIAAFQQADLIVLNGAGYEKWTEKVTLPRAKIVDTSKAFKESFMTMEHAVTHSHGPGGEHAHEGVAFTTWLDFEQAAQQAKAIAKAVSRKYPDLKKTVETNYAELEKDLMTLDRELKEIVAAKARQPLVASHPIYDYFNRRYGLNIKSMLWEPDVFPSAEAWMELEGVLKKHPAQWMIWEGEPLQESVDKLQALGLQGFVFAPCMNVPEEGDFLSVMQQNVENLQAAF